VYVLLSVLCILQFCIVLCIVSPHVYSCLFSTVYKFTVRCHRVETQLQLINIISYHISKKITVLIQHYVCPKTVVAIALFEPLTMYFELSYYLL
jgi:hypothetical protein